MATIKNYFPGGNTSKGFYSFYRYIISQKEAKRIFCIKGGPGTGKSTLMKEIGEYYYNKGYDIELHHCSSDNNSLDGVVIKGLNVVLIDGTAPHVVDPINPGAVDEILNLGECWNVDGFEKYRQMIIDTNKEVGLYFKKAYKYIAASKIINDDLRSYYSAVQNWGKINELMISLKNELLLEKKSNKTHKDRHMFATALTPNGIISFIENLTDDIQKIYVLQGKPGTGHDIILEYLYEEALRYGYYTEVFHSPLRPDKISHLIIPELDIALVSSNEIYTPQISHGRIINLNRHLNSTLLTKKSDEIDDCENDFYNLLNKGLDYLKIAKNTHDKLETGYIPNMDFNKINQVKENIISRINVYIK